MIRSEIKKQIFAAVQKEFGNILVPDFSVEPPENPEHGDYATNIALVLARFVKKNPMEIAAALAAELKVKSLKLRIETAPPGFINFRLSETVLQKELGEILKKKKKYGAGTKKKEKIQIEFISANPTGALTIGNGRGAFLGDALANVLSLSGFGITREYYVNNAKSSTQIKELGKTALGQGTTYLTEDIKKLIKKSAKKIKALKKKNFKNLEGEVGHLLAGEIQKENRKYIGKTLKIKFDVWLSEESLYKDGWAKKVDNLLQKRDAVYEKDGALWLKTSAGGDSEDRVLIRSNSEPTYFYSDLAAHLHKLSRGFQKIVYIWGADHHGHVARTKAALEILHLHSENFRFIITQLVRLVKDGKEVKMSKRAGTAVLFSDLIKEVGLDAARFFFLMHSPDTHMDFDMALAKERSLKNPVYYVQYAHARIVSIFRKAKKKNFKFGVSNFKLLRELEELRLIKKLIQFPEVVEDTARDCQVHRLAQYAMDLAAVFHNCYEKHRVITEDKELTQARIVLVGAVQIVLQNLLGLMGIDAPKRM